MKTRLVRFRSFWIFPCVAIALLYLTGPGDKRYLPLLFSIGLLLWTLIEYLFHRFVLHVEFRSPLVNKVANASHLGHHKAPRDGSQILVHPSFGIVISAILFGLFFVITGDPFRAAGLMTGIWAGFLYYEMVHYRVHMSLKSSPVLQQQRRAHFYHHFSDSSRCFGVTSPLWDYVFGTRR